MGNGALLELTDSDGHARAFQLREADDVRLWKQFWGHWLVSLDDAAPGDTT